MAGRAVAITETSTLAIAPAPVQSVSDEPGPTAREPERRPCVLALRDFAEKHQLALADASARWEHLAKEGLPYLTLLDNTINHPDDRGHRLFAEELWKCFR